MTRNEILYQQNVETERSNRARETETNRSNLANERENERSHLANEQETARSNRAREAETTRHNVETESQDWAKLIEQRRANLANEGIKAGTLNEQVRHNKVGESQSWASLNEQARHNQEQEDVAIGQLREQHRSNVVSENIKRETISSNENIASARNASNEFTSLMNRVNQADIAALDRQSREAIAQAQNEVQKRGQNISIINNGINALERAFGDSLNFTSKLTIGGMTDVY